MGMKGREGRGGGWAGWTKVFVREVWYGREMKKKEVKWLVGRDMFANNMPRHARQHAVLCVVRMYRLRL